MKTVFYALGDRFFRVGPCETRAGALAALLDVLRVAIDCGFNYTKIGYHVISTEHAVEDIELGWIAAALAEPAPKPAHPGDDPADDLRPEYDLSKLAPLPDDHQAARKRRLHAHWRAIAAHLRNACSQVSCPTQQGAFYDVARGVVAEAIGLVDNNELLLAFDTINDFVLNTGGDTDCLLTNSVYWMNMAQAARLMVPD